MQYVPINVKSQSNYLATQTSGNTVQFVDTTGTSRNWYNSADNSRPFNPKTFGSDISEGDTSSNMYCKASSTSAITSTYYTPTNTVGTTTIKYTTSSKGWNAIITVSGTEGAEINSLLFIKQIKYSSSASADAIMFAVILDNPVTIDSSGTANFTFGIEF